MTHIRESDTTVSMVEDIFLLNMARRGTLETQLQLRESTFSLTLLQRIRERHGNVPNSVYYVGGAG